MPEPTQLHPLIYRPTLIALIDQAKQTGLGAAAQVLGQPMDVRRLDDATLGSITNNAPIIQGLPVRVRRTTSKVIIESQPFDLQLFIATCDNRNLQIGDHLTEVGYRTTNAAYTVAQLRPLRETVLVRTEHNITITRPRPAGGQAAQNPPSGAIAAPGYVGMVKANEQVLTLIDGAYAFRPATDPKSASPAVVPAGLAQLNRIRDAKAPGLPTTLYREHFIAYVPTLPGDMINELDRLNFGQSDRYEVASFINSESVGLTGYVMIVEKLAS